MPCSRRARPRVGAIAALLAGLLALGGCASTSVASEPAVVKTGPVLLVPALSGGVSTTLTLDPAFTDTLETAGVVPSALFGATLSRRVLTLPITGGDLEVYDKLAVSPYVQGRVEHGRSGLMLRRADTEVSMTDLVMLPGRSLVTGKIRIDQDGPTTRTELFRLDGSTLQPLRHEQGHAVLDGTRVSLQPRGAALIRGALGLSTQQLPDGVFLGIAKLTVTAQP